MERDAVDGSSFDRISRRLAVTTSRRGGVAALVAQYGAPNWFNPGKVFASADQLTVWVTDIEHNQVSEWTRPDPASTTWSFSTAFGSIGTGNSNFDVPMGIVVNGAKDRAWIADVNNDRIVTWEILE